MLSPKILSGLAAFLCLPFLSTRILPAALEGEYRYRSTEIDGWTVLFQEELDEEADLQREVERLLAVKLWEVSSRLPIDVVERLQSVTIRMHLNREGCPGGVYHPSAAWLRDNGFPEDWAGGVEFGNARNFLGWTRTQPSMVLHELAHAWHHQVLGYDHSGILEAYGRVKASGSLDSTLYVTGGSKTAYALNNEMEFFAELSEAWWGTNDYYPFVKVEVMEDFPAMPALLESCWKLP